MTFAQSIISGDSGQGSTMRIGLLSLLYMLLVWSTAVVFKTYIIPEIPASWVYIIGLFITGVVGGKSVDAYRAIKGGAPAPSPDNTP